MALFDEIFHDYGIEARVQLPEIEPIFPIANQPPLLLQQQYDTTLAAFVYYQALGIELNPAASDTFPNHTGNLDSSTHAIVGEVGGGG